MGIEVEGSVESVTDGTGVLGGAIIPSDPISATLTYDTAASDIVSQDPEFGLYAQPVPPASFEMLVNGFSISVPSYTLGVINDNPTLGGTDSMLWRLEGSTFPFPGMTGVTISLVDVFLQDDTATALSDDSIPPGSPSLLDFPTSPTARIGGCADAGVSGNLCTSERFTIVAALTHVPEPTTAVSALLALALLRRERKRSVR